MSHCSHAGEHFVTLVMLKILGLVTDYFENIIPAQGGGNIKLFVWAKSISALYFVLLNSHRERCLSKGQKDKMEKSTSNFLLIRVADPYSLYTDPDPECSKISDPDPDPVF